MGTLHTPIDRVTAEDAVSLATDVGAAPMQVGALLLLGRSDRFDPERAVEELGRRVEGVPRLRQHLVRTPPGCGRPVWVDDVGFDVRRHVSVRAAPPPADEATLLAAAATVVTTRLPDDRPLWRAVVLTGLPDGGAAVVLAFHHVLADGIGGLAVLAALVDGDQLAGPVPGFPRSRPSDRELLVDATRSRLRAIEGAPASLRRLTTAMGRLRGTGARAARCSLNRPTGADRRLAVVRVELDAVVRAAHSHGATVNDVVVAAVAAALHRTLVRRGERVERFVISMPVSARRGTTAARLGNEVSAVPVEVPGTGPADRRLAEVAAATREARLGATDDSAALLGPAFRALSRLGLFRWAIDHQHLVHTFVTNLRGPAEVLDLLGAPIRDVSAIAVVTGNVTASFAVLSYAGVLGITIIADPGTCPDLDGLRDALQQELDELTAGP